MLNSPASGVADERSIAVLAFANRSSAADSEYFSDGISEEIINALSLIRGLKVIARTSSFAFKGQDRDVREIGQILGVSSILEGSVMQAQGRVLISARLISVADGGTLWTRNFDRELRDIFALQDEISLLIADQIREHYGHFDVQDHLVPQRDVNVKAYDLYLRGRFHQLKWNPADLQAATDWYKRSIEIDPQYALPHYGLVQCYGIMASWNFMDAAEGNRQADYYFLRGLGLDDSLVEAYFARATKAFWVEWDVAAGRSHIQRAIDIYPAFTEGHESMAEMYTAIGDFSAAIKHTEAALQRNPLSCNHLYTRGNIYYLSGAIDLALNQMQQILKLDGEWLLAQQLTATCLILQNNEAGLERFLREYSAFPNTAESRRLFALFNARDASYVKIDNLDDPKLLDWELYCLTHSGRISEALVRLENLVRAHAGRAVNFVNDPLLVPLRTHQRFQNLAESAFGSNPRASLKSQPQTAQAPATDLEAAPQAPTAAQVVAGKSQTARSQTAESHTTGPEEDPAALRARFSAFEQRISREQLYLDPSLNLKKLAGILEIHPNRLSWIINELGAVNFNVFINAFRLEDFQRRALDPANQHVTLLGLAYDSGFNSKTVFNQFFKKQLGMTPRAWMRLHQ